MGAISELRCFGNWMTVRFPARYRCLSWAVVNGGETTADTVAWLFLQLNEIEHCDDPRAWFRSKLAAEELEQAVGLLTSRRRHGYVESGAGTGCHVVATVGLSNALAAGDPVSFVPRKAGTINILCALDEPLSREAALEALGLAAEARTAALMEAHVPSVVSGRDASGTGTDCIVIAHPSGSGGDGAPYCGKHTPLGQRIGWHVRDAISRGVAEWLEENRR